MKKFTDRQENEAVVEMWDIMQRFALMFDNDNDRDFIAYRAIKDCTTQTFYSYNYGAKSYREVTTRFINLLVRFLREYADSLMGFECACVRASARKVQQFFNL